MLKVPPDVGHAGGALLPLPGEDRARLGGRRCRGLGLPLPGVHPTPSTGAARGGGRGRHGQRRGVNNAIGFTKRTAPTNGDLPLLQLKIVVVVHGSIGDSGQIPVTDPVTIDNELKLHGLSKGEDGGVLTT